MVVIDSNFEGADSFIYFGEDPLKDNRKILGTATSARPDQWTMTVNSVILDGLEYNDFTNAVAELESSYQHIALPTEIHTRANILFESAGFICSGSTSVISVGNCEYAGTCDNVAGSLPNLVFNFAGTDGTGTTSSFELTITPEVYLFEDTANSQCNTQFTENQDTNNGFILGDPFFRNATIMLDWQNKSISLFDKEVDTPIVPIPWPVIDESLTFTETLNVTDELIYSGNFTVGRSDIGSG
jgi:hypothetical protein